MDKTVLVNAELAKGLELVQALDRSDPDIRVAMWLYPEEFKDWRFVLASPRLDSVDPAAAYGLVHDALTATGISYVCTPILMILKMSDPFIRGLRRMFSKSKSVQGMRLGGQFVGDRFIEDALV